MAHHFFAYLGRLRWINRWGLKRNAIAENVMEHSFEVATTAHALALIDQKFFNGSIDPRDVAVAALYHDASEVLTGDLPSPIKYHNSKIRDAYKSLEHTAECEMLATLPAELQDDFAKVLLSNNISDGVHKFVKAADLIASYTKCKAEVRAGNQEFSHAVIEINDRLDQIDMAALDYFREHFLHSFDLSLDELIKPNESPL